jgi:tripartite-type tricarboxylate transporter receptor subunit TctC
MSKIVMVMTARTMLSGKEPGMGLLSRRTLLAAPLLLPLAARAQGRYPARLVRVIVPYPAGGGTDTWARLVIEGMQPELGQTLIIDNRGGGNGLIGTEAAAKAEPDGHQLLFTITTHVQVPVVMRRFTYHPVNDFAPIGRLSYTAVAFCVGPKVPAEVTTLKQFVDWARGRDISLGNYAAGSHGHAFALMLAREAKLTAVNIAYRGESPMLQDILNGSIEGGFHSMAAAGEMVRAGRVRALAVAATKQRIPSLPDAPTMQELGYSERFGFTSFAGMFAPARTPQPVIDKLAEAFRIAALKPETQKRLTNMDTVPAYLPPAEFKAQIERSLQEWTEMVEALDLRMDG